MPISESNGVKLRILRDIYEVSLALSTKTYIWAGLVQDVITGEFISEHGDIDGFTHNLWELKDQLEASYRDRGYDVSFLEDVNFMRIDLNGAHAMFNRLEINDETAMWRHIGDEGTVYFPKSWLCETALDFYDAKVYVSGIEFEYCIKTHPELLGPEWKGRLKDIDTIAWLRRMLSERCIEEESILKQIWSYNPYFAKKGYKQYLLPSVARKLEPTMEFGAT